MATKKENNQDNLSIYEQLRSVPSNAQKQFSNGTFKGTDINPMWRIKRLTEKFGACGFGWYYEVVHRNMEVCNNGEVMAFIGINLYVKVNGEWSKPIYGEGGNTMTTYFQSKGYYKNSDEAYKMALTDAVSNATKQLGLGADIWYGADVNVVETKYTKREQQEKEVATLTQEQVDKQNIATLQSFTDTTALKNFFYKLPKDAQERIRPTFMEIGIALKAKLEEQGKEGAA